MLCKIHSIFFYSVNARERGRACQFVVWGIFSFIVDILISPPPL